MRISTCGGLFSGGLVYPNAVAATPERKYIYVLYIQVLPATATRGSGVDFLRISTCGGLFSGGLFNK